MKEILDDLVKIGSTTGNKSEDQTEVREHEECEPSATQGE